MWNDSLLEGPIAIDGVPGYHINIPEELLTRDLETFVVEPTNPRHVFCDHNTVYLKFADEDEARRSSLGRYWIDA